VSLVKIPLLFFLGEGIMIKKLIFILLIIIFIFGLTGCNTANNSKTGPAAKAAIAYFDNVSKENIEVLSVDMDDKEHVIVKLKVNGKNKKVFLEKFGNEWEVKFVN
jgi:uncharacterized lipoprotein NlpE involved in copper resistance